MVEDAISKDSIATSILGQIRCFLDENDEEYFSENREVLKVLSGIVSTIVDGTGCEDAALLHIDLDDMYYRCDCSDGMDGHLLDDEEAFLVLMEDYIDKGFRSVWQKLEDYVEEYQNPADSLYGFSNLVQVGHYIRRRIESGDEDAKAVYERIFESWSKTNEVIAARTKEILDGLDLDVEWYDQDYEEPEWN